MTAEFAVLLPAVVVLLALLLVAAGAGILQLRLEEGARAGARALARGDDRATAVTDATRVAGDDAHIGVDEAGGYATVSVTAPLGGPLAGLLNWQQSARAVARLEHDGGHGD